MAALCVDGLLQVAVKLMNHSSDEDARAHCQRLDCEAFVWSRQDHRNIVPFLGVFDLPGCHFPVLISPYYEFGHIGKYLGNNPRAMKIPLMHDVVSGMKHLHDHGVVHGDVKPENFLVDKHGVACVIDFGTSRIQGIKGFTTSHRPSTSVYYAPEMWGAPDEAGAEASFKSDVWAVACVLLGIMGSFPIKTVAKLRHQGSNFVTLRSDLADLLRPTREQYAPDVVPDHIWAVLKKCWALDPEERQTMVAIHAFFEELVG
ncbi:kinase-like domain-containing protein [Mycena olivaceomarginata]|nr:kinase-like domain-containing protein [Mycena olivaceomarginata]